MADEHTFTLKMEDKGKPIVVSINKLTIDALAEAFFERRNHFMMESGGVVDVDGMKEYLEKRVAYHTGGNNHLILDPRVDRWERMSAVIAEKIPVPEYLKNIKEYELQKI